MWNAGVGVAVGAGVGVALGAALGNMPLWLAIGTSAGVVAGAIGAMWSQRGKPPRDR